MEYIKTNGELYHHGVLGQKWGQRNGPPYPLKPGQHSAAEKKAGWTKSVSSTTGGVKKKSVKTGGFKEFATRNDPIVKLDKKLQERKAERASTKTGGLSRRTLENAEASTRNKTHKSAENYKDKKESLENAKSKNKEEQTKESRDELRNARKETRAAEKEVRRQLKAEAGRDLYAKGQTVEKYAKKQVAVGFASVGAGYVAKSLARSGNDKAAVVTMAASAAVWLGYNIYAEAQKNKLRAYYAAS